MGSARTLASAACWKSIGRVSSGRFKLFASAMMCRRLRFCRIRPSGASISTRTTPALYMPRRKCTAPNPGAVPGLSDAVPTPTERWGVQTEASSVAPARPLRRRDLSLEQLTAGKIHELHRRFQIVYAAVNSGYSQASRRDGSPRAWTYLSTRPTQEDVRKPHPFERPRVVFVGSSRAACSRAKLHRDVQRVRPTRRRRHSCRRPHRRHPDLVRSSPGISGPFRVGGGASTGRGVRLIQTLALDPVKESEASSS